MNRRLLATATLVLSSLFATQAVLAAPSAIHAPVHAFFGKTKLVSFSLRNDSSTPITLKAGTDVMTIAPGKTLAVKLAPGTSVTTQDATPTMAAGTVIAQVSSDISDATIAVK